MQKLRIKTKIDFMAVACFTLSIATAVYVLHTLKILGGL